MKRWIVMMLVLGLMFVGCTKQEEAVESAKEAVESAKEAVGSAKEVVESAKEAVTGEAGEEERLEKGCLQLVSEAKFDDALPICLAALKNDPANDEVKAAAEKAQKAVADSTAAAAAAATDAAQDAQEAVGEQAQDAQEAAEEKAQGAVDEAIGGLPQ